MIRHLKQRQEAATIAHADAKVRDTVEAIIRSIAEHGSVIVCDTDAEMLQMADQPQRPIHWRTVGGQVPQDLHLPARATGRLK